MKPAFSHISDINELLVRKIAMGDQKAFEQLYHLYYNRLCQFSFLFLHSKELSEEAVSDVFLNVWMKREQLSQVRNIRSYLYTAVHHQAIDYLRAKNTHPHDDINVYELEMESPEPLADDVMEHEQFRELLQQAFDELPERCRMIARMHYNDQLQYKEIAEILHISRKTVESQIKITIRKVKDFFKKNGL